MNFQDFLKNVSQVESMPLTGVASHIKMAPSERVRLLEESNLHFENAKKAAVLMLFYPKNDITYLALIIRNSYPGVHSSQIAFPGGKVENYDKSLQDTALRETHEEIGISPDKVTVVRSFSEIYIPPSNFLVAPFLGFAEVELEFTKQLSEVAGIIEFPVSRLLDDKTVSTKVVNASYKNNLEVPVFQIEEHSVWGATAMMLSELKDVLKMVF
jgi:8-oxo-dGTP pyrophosphatase MutT (NUDIX family)